jgi:hypothetical protein
MPITRGIFLLALFCASFLSAQTVQAAKVVPSFATPEEVQLDGLATEDAWKNIEAVTTFDSIAEIEISIKSVYTDTMIYFLVSFPDKNESRLHRCWVWDNKNEMYNEGQMETGRRHKRYQYLQ